MPPELVALFRTRHADILESGGGEVRLRADLLADVRKALSEAPHHDLPWDPTQNPPTKDPQTYFAGQQRNLGALRFISFPIFLGGNLAGVMERLVYLEQLGVSCLYSRSAIRWGCLNRDLLALRDSPLFLSATNHRYDTASYEQIDPALGTAAQFRQLLKEVCWRFPRSPSTTSCVMRVAEEGKRRKKERE